MRINGTNAVVLGAGMAGLLAARVLVESFERVTVVERDELEPGVESRRGVPQGRHAHGLLPRGCEILGELFPGFEAELVEDGAVRAELLADFRFTFGGHVLRQAPIGVSVVQAGREFLERHVRDRVRALPGVTLRDGCDVAGLVTEGDRVTGVRVVSRRPGSAEEHLGADLVVDAMGRGARTPAWLDKLGYPRPTEEEFKISVGYASRLLRLPAGAELEKAVAVGAVPGRPRGMMLLAVEDGRRLLTLAGIGTANHPPTDDEGFLDFAASVAPADALDLIKRAEPVSPVALHRYPSYIRRRYEQLVRFPDGLLVIGDALCSFSPVYGQGMTVAALQAVALRRSLAAGPAGLARRYFRAAAREIDPVWRMAIGADLALPEVPGRRSLAGRAMTAWVGRVQAAAARDAAVAEQFMRVTGLLDPPARLVHPALVRRVLSAGWN
ncbi:FAD-dependent monooxygenase [Actinoplanes sp. NPDC024001]|uniref:FAD-dependent oxidoreductase n=1 Tax=Actinoplanes sp. NPDC024001 TaxID=3154598 RepID=UPI0033ED4FD0